MKIKERFLKLDKRTRQAIIFSGVMCAMGVVGATYYLLVQHDVLAALGGLTLELTGAAYFAGWVDSRRALRADIEERDK
jgi:hypothetical protein